MMNFIEAGMPSMPIPGLIDFLIGLLLGSIIGRYIVIALTNNSRKQDEECWYHAPEMKPPIGVSVLAYTPRSGYNSVTYLGPDGGGEIPENMKMYWRYFPKPPCPRETIK